MQEHCLISLQDPPTLTITITQEKIAGAEGLDWRTTNCSDQRAKLRQCLRRSFVVGRGGFANHRRLGVAIPILDPAFVARDLGTGNPLRMAAGELQTIGVLLRILHGCGGKRSIHRLSSAERIAPPLSRFCHTPQGARAKSKNDKNARPVAGPTMARAVPCARGAVCMCSLRFSRVVVEGGLSALGEVWRHLVLVRSTAWSASTRVLLVPARTPRSHSPPPRRISPHTAGSR